MYVTLLNGLETWRHINIFYYYYYYYYYYITIIIHPPWQYLSYSLPLPQ